MLAKHERCGGLRADSVTETDQIDFQVPSAWDGKEASSAMESCGRAWDTVD